jgi:ABC-type multidrug transport system fused ATPase/permease subunit
MLLLKPYRFLVALLVLLTIAGNGLNLVAPKLISKAIDTYTQGRFALHTVILQFVAVAVLVFILSYAQSAVQTGRRNAWARICERAWRRRSPCSRSPGWNSSRRPNSSPISLPTWTR